MNRCRNEPVWLGGCGVVMSERVYLDHNASSPLRPEARAAMLAALDLEGNPSSVHAEGRAARAVIEAAREEVAALVGAAPSQVIFTSGGTEANNMALEPSVLRHFRLASEARMDGARAEKAGLENGAELEEPGGLALVSAIEHASVRAGGQFMADELIPIPANEAGEITPAAMQATVERVLDHIIGGAGDDGAGDEDEAAGRDGEWEEDDDPLFLASVMLANNETGVKQPVRELTEICHQAGGLMHTDAVQAAGKMPVDFAALGVDLMSLSAHKLGGPKGVGALILKDDEILEHAWLLTGGGQENRRRAGTENLAGIAGFGAAAKAAREALDSETERWRALQEQLETALKKIAPEVVIFGAAAERLPNTTCFAIAGMRAETLLMQLDLAGIAVSAGSACSSGKLAPSEVLAAMGVSEELARAAIRISFGWSTDKADIETFLRVWEQQYVRFRARRPAA